MRLIRFARNDGILDGILNGILDGILNEIALLPRNDGIYAMTAI